MKNEINVGKLLNITYDTDTNKMQVLLEIVDDDFKEHLLRNMALKEKIAIKGDDVMWKTTKEK